MPLKDVLSEITDAWNKGESFDLNMSKASAKDVIEVSNHIKNLTGKDVFKPLVDAHNAKEPISLEFPSKEPNIGAGKSTGMGQGLTETQRIGEKVTGLLPAAGMIAGGAAVSPLVAAQVAAAPVTGGSSIGTGIATGAFGAGVGGAAGEGLRQLGHRAIGLPTPIPSESALNIAKAAGEGALMEAGVGTGAAILKGIAKPFSSTIKANAPEISRIAQKLGIKLTPADINTNPWLKKFEDLMSNTWIGADSMNDARNAQSQALHDAKLGLSKKYGTKLNTEEINKEISNSIIKKSQAENAVVKDIYEKRNAIIDMKKEMPIKHTLLASNAIQTAEQRAIIKGDLDLLSITANFSKAVPGSTITPQRATFETISDAISKINDKIVQENALNMSSGLKGAAGQSTQKGRLLYQIKQGLQKDLDNYLRTQPKEARALNTLAKKKYTEFSQTFKSDEIRDLADKDPMAIVKYLINTGRVKEFDMVKRAIGKEGIKPVQQLFFQDIIDQAISESGKLNMKAIDKVMASYKPEILSRVMDPKAVKELKEISTIVSNLATKGITIENQKHLGIFQNIGAYGLSKIYSSESGRKLLMEGLTVKPGTEQAARYATKAAQFMTMYGVTLNDTTK
jgi:hypothetical protein